MESLCPAISAMAAPGNAVSMVAPSCKALHSMAARSTFAWTSPSLQIQPSRSLPFSVPRRFHLSCASMAPTQEKVDEAGDVAELQEKNHSLSPNSFEVQSLLMEVCDETSIAELELKVGAFKLHVKRDVGKLKGSAPAVAVAPPVPSKPMVESAISIPVAAPKSPSLSSTTVLASPVSKSDSKSGLLEAAADEGLLFVTSPKVGLFRKSRVVKGKSGRPLCEERQTVKEGQVVCYVEQLGTQQPVEAETSGEVTKILCKDGEPVGYGDPLIAIRPSFPGIK